MSEPRSELSNEQINRILDGTALASIPLHLSDETAREVQRVAERNCWSFAEVLTLAFTYCIALVHEEHRLEESENPRAFDPARLRQEVQELSSRYAGMKFQVFKLRKGILLEETRLAGTAGQNETYEDLIGRLRARLGER